MTLKVIKGHKGHLKILNNLFLRYFFSLMLNLFKLFKNIKIMKAQKIS